ncbi:hypothetical protein KBB17_01440 [Candidatus Saccharibacteria bacterium]|nr:hypothetical protein [Candidatus Saccharibacteria bacterium]MBP9132265.1 hypothetical protein [Candidatus Saccharibacteria bacterium]
MNEDGYKDMIKYGFLVPIALIAISMLLFTGLRFASNYVEITNSMEKTANISLFIFGVASVMTILPGTIIAIIGLIGIRKNKV